MRLPEKFPQMVCRNASAGVREQIEFAKVLESSS